jgi:hypothetical protein
LDISRQHLYFKIKLLKIEKNILRGGARAIT